MFFMSFGDIILSVSIALTTIPMPTEVLEFFPFPGGLVYGNKRTCETQGFLMLLGAELSLLFNAILNVYYVCTIRYGISDIRIRKRYLPIMLTIAFLLSLPIPIMLLNLNYFEPHTYSMNCYIGAEPISPPITDQEIIDKKKGMRISMVVFALCFIGSTFLLIVLSLILVVTAVYLKDGTSFKSSRNESMQMERGSNNEIDDSFTDDETQEVDYRPRQAVMYIAAFLLSWLPVLIGGAVAPKSIPVHVVRSILSPLQGFFNATIFIYHKIHNLRRSSIGEYTFFGAAKIAIISPRLVPEILVSRIELVVLDELNRDREELAHRAAYFASSRIRGGGELMDDPNASACSPSIACVSVDRLSCEVNTLFNECDENGSQRRRSLQSQALSGFYNTPVMAVEDESLGVLDTASSILVEEGATILDSIVVEEGVTISTKASK
uniref:G-protein coupled receptors family 1 profile domain-containing protein n=1 Tax=Chaetoceros debilis TaxID=122233 RepID=A0A7S3V6F1_9STRA|eukprot:CAMPEP_0194094244 /NCGR_PEP_ID=MMETSP0149-20130528/53306_1 /TAXON_ID=122233 /ORGANISM="Chaetoceros debilis, Strain MM31A-1" /LENGTH=436 /DNA_ID=CAMNT_0038779829 /DNA_START=92 /DNA_END=1402 /DNA_ORIENTATION=+